MHIISTIGSSFAVQQNVWIGREFCCTGSRSRSQKRSESSDGSWYTYVKFEQLVDFVGRYLLVTIIGGLGTGALQRPRRRLGICLL